MRSFNSSFNYGGNDFKSIGKRNNTSSDSGSSSAKNIESKFDVDNIKVRNLTLNSTMKSLLLDEKNVNISQFSKYVPMGQRQISSNAYGDTESPGGYIWYENPFTLPIDAIHSMNNYRFKYNTDLKTVHYSGDDGKVLGEFATVPSLFNPLFNVQYIGMMPNVPLLNGSKDNMHYGNYSDANLSDCSIRTLVALSNKPNSILGIARYRYADFMYCKDLGKVSNNHLITLRKFAFPIGDHIFEFNSPAYHTSQSGLFEYGNSGEVGRLVAWFDTDDNKLEDILTYSYQASWKPLESKLDPVKSTENDAARGPIGWVINTLSNENNEAVKQGIVGKAGENSLWGWLGGKISVLDNKTQSEYEKGFTNYDANKVYTPKNTVQDTHIYEGKLTFAHEFTLNFSYKMRAYENINPKSAFLDLIGNILEVTYRRGKFWGGDRVWIGPQPNLSAWNKANAIADQAWHKIGGIMGAASNGTMDFQSILGTLGDAISNGARTLVNKASEVWGNLLNGNYNEKIKEIGDAGRGMLMNMLGRPSMYALDSLLSGDNVGLWHVTIGNPKNPIVAFGNLIMTDAKITHMGPLGIDDFPTELRVSVTLKHAKSRDLTEISRMYTKGLSSIYMSNAVNKTSEIYGFPYGSPTAAGDVESRIETLSQARMTTHDAVDEINKGLIEGTKTKEDAEKKQKDTEEVNKLSSDLREYETNLFKGTMVSYAFNKGIYDKSYKDAITNSKVTVGFSNIPNPLATNDVERFISETNELLLSEARMAITEIA